MPPLSAFGALPAFGVFVGPPHTSPGWPVGLWVWCPPMHHSLPLGCSLFVFCALNPTRSPAAGSGPWSASRAGVQKDAVSARTRGPFPLWSTWCLLIKEEDIRRAQSHEQVKRGQQNGLGGGRGWGQCTKHPGALVPAERGAGVHGAVVPSMGTEDALARWPEHRDRQGKCSWGRAETPTPAR